MKKFLFSFGLATMMLVFLSMPVSASVQDFTIENFDANYILDNSVPGGHMDAIETIEVNFTDYNHGIYRYLPKKYRGYNTHLKVSSITRDGQKEDYLSSSENDNLVLKIGNANKTITGKHIYKISYSQDRVINFTSDGHQEFYWDVNGNGWTQQFLLTKATVTTRTGGLPSGQNLECYTGFQGSTDQNCMSSSGPNNATFVTTVGLSAGQNMTIVVPFTDSTFSPVALSKIERLRQNPWLNVLYYVWPSVIAILVMMKAWSKYGKDYKGRGVIVPEYEPPKNLSPAEVGMLADYNVDGKDLSATLIDLAVRGYIKIHEEVKKVLFFTTRNYSLELINNDFSKLKPHEKSLIDAVFVTKTPSELINMSDLRKRQQQVYKQITSLKKQIKDSLTKQYGLIDNSGNKTHVFIVIGLILLGFILFVMPEQGFKFNLILLVPAYLIFVSSYNRRSHAGQETYEQIMGLKDYMNLAEKDRLKMLQSVDRPFTEPSKTVHLFEKLLPFAVALGVEKSWARQFDGVLTQSPSWMTSNVAGFSGANMASSLGGVASNFSSSFETSSGSGGSGASGGGGGGGGGGGW